MTKGKIGMAVIGLSLLLMTPAPFADTAITLRGISDGKQTLIQVRNGVARMGDVGDPDYSLYEKSRNTLIHVESGNRSYMEIDQQMISKQSEQMAGMQGMMATQMEQMRAQLQNMPPEQRAMMEAQMGSMMGMPPADAAPGKKLRAEPRSGKNISGINCQAYELFDGPRKVAEVCLATAGDAGIPAGDFATLMAMMDFMRDMARKLPMMGEPGDPLMMSDLRGVPLEMKGSADGDDFTLESVSSNKLDASLFEAYKAFRKRDVMEGMTAQ